MAKKAARPLTGQALVISRRLERVIDLRRACEDELHHLWRAEDALRVQLDRVRTPRD
jgi:demethoxyubiquinone hydroxylase (CLK1/Coq7/Cat5 family)